MTCRPPGNLRMSILLWWPPPSTNGRGSVGPPNGATGPATEGAVAAAYTAAGLGAPRLMVWMDSPLGGMLAVRALRATRRVTLGEVSAALQREPGYGRVEADSIRSTIHRMTWTPARR